MKRSFDWVRWKHRRRKSRGRSTWSISKAKVLYLLTIIHSEEQIESEILSQIETVKIEDPKEQSSPPHFEKKATKQASITDYFNRS